MPGPVQNAITSIITAFDGASLDRTHHDGSESGTLHQQLMAAGFREEAETIRNLWPRLRAALDQAQHKATKAGK